MPSLSRKKRITILLVGIAVFAWVAQSAYRSLSLQKATQLQESGTGLLEEGNEFPLSVQLDPIGKSSGGLEQYRGKVIVLNFWAGWCPPCLHEMPDIYALQKKLQGKGLMIVGINMDDKSEDGLRVLKQRRLSDAPIPFYHGGNSTLAERFSITGLPFTVVIGRDLKIKYAGAGELNWQDGKIVSLIEGLL